MKRLCGALLLLGCAHLAVAAPNVTNANQKGSLLVFPDIRIDNTPSDWNTLIRIQNDGTSDIDLVCYWMDGFKNRVDFAFTITANQAIWFDARTGNGTYPINPFPTGSANGFPSYRRHPFLGLPGQIAADAGFGPYRKGLLACWAVAWETGVPNPIQRSAKWNHLSGTATVHNATLGAYEYNAFAFYVPLGVDRQVVSLLGAGSNTLPLNSMVYDACPLYVLGQFTPNTWSGEGFAATPAPLSPLPEGALSVTSTRLAVTGCHIDLSQDWLPTWTKLQFDVWNEDEVKFTGAHECADTWHETDFRPGSSGQLSNVGTPSQTTPGYVDGIDSAQQNFTFGALGTYAARYRVQGFKSTQCDRTRPVSGPGSDVADVQTSAVGLLAVQAMQLTMPDYVGTTLATAGKQNGQITWDPPGVVPEGGIR